MTNEEIIEQTKACFRDALFGLMAGRPYADITITDIAKAAGLGRATFYRHFQTKEDLIRDYLAHLSDAFRQATSVSIHGEDDFYEIIFHVLSVLKEQRENIRLIQEAGLEGFILTYMNEAMVEHFKRNGFGETTYTPYYFTGSLFNVSMQWIRNQCRDSLRQVADLYVKLLFLKLPDDVAEKKADV